MPNTKSKTRGRIKQRTASALEVLTLPEAAAYLRVDENRVLQMAQQGDLPGRRLGNEWRFFKAALQAWLSNVPSYKERLMELAGAWKDDPYLEEIVRQAYQKRAGSMAENEE
jgi:excisionase family DNA binding protein